LGFGGVAAMSLLMIYVVDVHGQGEVEYTLKV